MSVATMPVDTTPSALTARPRDPGVGPLSDRAAPRLPRRLRVVQSEPPLDREPDMAGCAVALPLSVRPTAPGRTVPTGSAHRDLTAPLATAIREPELGGLFGAEPTPRSALPDPRPRAAAAVRVLLEVLCGDRPSRQLAAWVSPTILEHLERRHPERFRHAPRRCQLRSLRITEPAECVAEAAAVVCVPATERGHSRERFRAVALRLEGADGRWTITALTVG
jgi:hypothetical protein